MSYHDQSGDRPLNVIRSEALSRAMQDVKGSKALFLTDAFPFLIIGRIVAVKGDFVLVRIETTHILELEGRITRLHLDDIEAFYVENGGPSIPEIR